MNYNKETAVKTEGINYSKETVLPKTDGINYNKETAVTVLSKDRGHKLRQRNSVIKD